jgi:hypothetical protein
MAYGYRGESFDIEDLSRKAETGAALENQPGVFLIEKNEDKNESRNG